LVFDVLRRRVLMVLKLNELTRCVPLPLSAARIDNCNRHSDKTLATIHSHRVGCMAG
jgi:hypothetical protein